MSTSRPFNAFQTARLNDSLHRLFKAQHSVSPHIELDPENLVSLVEMFADRAEKFDLIARTSIEKWGEKAQGGQAMEECGELIVAAHKYFFRDHNGATVDELASEVADVEIMMYCLRLVIGNQLVEAEKQFKLHRLGTERLGLTL